MKWQRLSREEIKQTVFSALDQNVNYYNEKILGLPASHLDKEVFYQDAPFLKDAPFLTTLIHNPNHIGCHTLEKSESFFRGTQKIERELIKICAEDICKGDPDEQDGYVAAGGSEANMQALWIYRNFFTREHEAKIDEIAVICSEDAHYSSSKACNILQLRLLTVQVDSNTRKITQKSLDKTVEQLKVDGVKYVIVMANLMTTMFGSVDDTELYAATLKKANIQFKMHIDGAFGGFYYPFAADTTSLSFANPDVTSITLDAHKMLQAPYGTGLFLVRKGYMKYTMTEQASYVEGEDFTLIGSRSGANAIAIWMILATYGPHGWFEKIMVLKNRADWLEKQIQELNIPYFREVNANIITLKAGSFDENIAKEYGLVPDNHHNPSWWKIVIMDHVTMEKLEPFINDVKKSMLNQ